MAAGVSTTTDLLPIRAYVCGGEKMLAKATQTVAELAKNHQFTLEVINIPFNSDGMKTLNATKWQGLRSSIVFLDLSIISRDDAIRPWQTVFDVNRVAFIVVGEDKESLLSRMGAWSRQYPSIHTLCTIEYAWETSQCSFLANSEAALNRFLEETPRDVPSTCVLL